jgi:hypothetical protein
VGCQERGEALPLALTQSMTIQEGGRDVVVTHVDGSPRNFFEWMDYMMATGSALLLSRSSASGEVVSMAVDHDTKLKGEHSSSYK